MSQSIFRFLIIPILVVSVLQTIQGRRAESGQPTRTITTSAEDEAELRIVIEAYFDALRNKDWQRLDDLEAKRILEMIVNGSDSHGPLVPFNASLELTKRLLAHYQIESLRFSIHKVEIEVPKATAHISFSLSVSDPTSGTKVVDLVNLDRVLRFEKYQSTWKLNSDSADNNSLEEQVKKATTFVERQFLFSQENLPELGQARESFKKDGVRFIEQGTLDKSFGVFGLAQEINDHIGERSTVATLVRSQLREESIAEHRVSGKLEGLALNLLWAGQDYATLRDYSKAKGHLDESIKLLEQLGNKEDLAKAHKEIAAVYLEEGRYSDAVRSYEN